MDKGGRELYSLLVAQGEVIELIVYALAQAQLFKELSAGPLGGRLVHTVQRAKEDQLAEQRFFPVEAALFWHITNAAAVIVINRGVIKVDFAGVFRQHT